MSQKNIHTLEKILCILTMLLIVVLLAVSFAVQHKGQAFQNKKNYQVVKNVTYQKLEDAKAPAGVVSEFCFLLDGIHHGDNLTFYMNHYNVDVFLEEECVYHVEAQDGPVHTTGGVWVMVPVYEKDQGKNVRVLLTPVYKDYQDEVPEFLLGSELAIYKSVMHNAFPEMLLSICSILAGVVLLLLAVYQNIKGERTVRLYAVGVLAVAAGLWRITYGRFIYMILGEHSIFVYNLSIVALMLIALSMLNCVELRDNQKGHNVIRYSSMIYCALYMIQFLLQITGVLDLRQMLKVTHMTIVCSAIVFAITISVSGRSKSR